MRGAWPLFTGTRRAWPLALVVACTHGPHPDDRREVEIDRSNPAIPGPTLTALRAAMTASATLYWRLPGPDGPVCEPWQLEPDPDDPSHGRLVHHAAPLHFRFRYQLSDDQLQLAAPERERDLPPAPGAVGVSSLALPCVFSGMSFAPDDPGAPRRLALAGRERWFLDPASCAAADPVTPAPDELRPLGCASALADPATRLHAEQTSQPGPAALRLLRSRSVWLLRRRAGHTTCESWHHEPVDDQRGTLTLRHRDEHGPRTLAYGYAVAGDHLTLLGPHEFRRTRKPDGELTRAGGCLLTRALRLHADVLTVGDDRWYLRRRDCEQARRRDLPPPQDPDCGAAPPT